MKWSDTFCKSTRHKMVYPPTSPCKHSYAFLVSLKDHHYVIESTDKLIMGFTYKNYVMCLGGFLYTNLAYYLLPFFLTCYVI